MYLIFLIKQQRQKTVVFATKYKLKRVTVATAHHWSSRCDSLRLLATTIQIRRNS